MPRPKAPADRRQRTNTPGVGQLVPTERESVPELRGELLDVTLETWAEFWQSDVSSLVVPSDLPALRRLFSLYDERERCYADAVAGGRTTRGSTGQETLAPLYKHVTTLDEKILALEDRFGMTPLARLKLGAQLGDAAKSLDEMNRRLADDDDDAPDPRAAAIDVSST